MVRITSFLSAFLGLTLFLGLSTVASAAADDLVQQAQEKLQAGDAEQAYELLVAEEAEYAGNIAFDYWLGMAGVRAGEYGRASFALERVIAEQPNHAAARLELAAAYVALNQTEPAAQQLDQLETMDPPPKAADRIAELEKAVGRRQEQTERAKQLFFVTLTGGHDNNVGTEPDDTPANIAGISSTSAPFLDAQLGGTRLFNVTPSQKVGVSGQLYTRRHDSGDANEGGSDDPGRFDRDVGMLTMNWISDLDGRRELEIGAEGSIFRLDGEDYYNRAGLYGTWRDWISDALDYDVTLRGNDFSFDVDSNDYFLWSLSSTLKYQVRPRWRLNLNFRVEREDANEDRVGGDARGLMLGFGSRYALASRHVLTGSLNYERTDYSDKYPGIFQGTPGAPGEDRSDDRYKVNLGHEWYPSNNWRVRTQVRYADQESTLDLFSYDRTSGSVSITRYF